MLHNFKHNVQRVLKKGVKHIVEIGDGDYTEIGALSRGTKKAIVDKEYGQAIGHDCYAKERYSIALGTHQKCTEMHTMGEGGYFSIVERYGEKKRTFHTVEGEQGYGLYEWANRSWFEWFGEIWADPNLPYLPITLHNTGNKLVLKDRSALTFNIKIVGTDRNSNPLVNGYHISGTIKRGTGAGTIAIVGTPTIQQWRDNPNINVMVMADPAMGALDLTIQADSASTYYWAASGWVTEFKFL